MISVSKVGFKAKVQQCPLIIIWTIRVRMSRIMICYTEQQHLTFSKCRDQHIFFQKIYLLKNHVSFCFTFSCNSMIKLPLNKLGTKEILGNHWITRTGKLTHCVRLKVNKSYLMKKSETHVVTDVWNTNHLVIIIIINIIIIVIIINIIIIIIIINIIITFER